MKVLCYRIVDVFTTRPLEGNALAVFPDATDLDRATMQKIARELNLSETVFITPPSSSTYAARLQIFTPTMEMAFAGHPTIGASFVLIDEERVASGLESFFLEELIGPVKIDVERGQPPMIWLKTPPIAEGPHYDRSICAAALGLNLKDLLGPEPQLLDAGNPTLLVAVKDRDAVDRAWLDLEGACAINAHRPRGADSFCVFVFTPMSEGAYSRMFAPEYGIIEDPATGSSTGPLAAFMMRHGLAASESGTHFISEQGTKMGRPSKLHVKIVGQYGRDGIYVGGHVTPLAKGTMELGVR